MLAAAKKVIEQQQHPEDNVFFSGGVLTAPVTPAIRYTYSPTDKSWQSHSALFRVESTPFSKGALRGAYRCLETEIDACEILTATSRDWRRARQWVLKRFLTPQEDELAAVQSDVISQTIAKFYGNLYNRADPPRKIDFLEASYIVATLPDGSTQIYAAEAYVEGDYIKYSNNSGWLAIEENRSTPHTFSHFTYVASQGELMIVDIQGVGDLWTDPVIHYRTTDAASSGDLGVRGMALFLYSHECNGICRHIGLPAFPLHSDQRPWSLKNWRGLTCGSFASILSLLPKHNTPLVYVTPGSLEPTDQPVSSPLIPSEHVSSPALSSSDSESASTSTSTSSSSSSSSSSTSSSSSRHHRLRTAIPDSIPEQGHADSRIHHMLGRLHNLGRIAQLDEAFVDSPTSESKPDRDAAFWHYQKAAHEGDLSGILACARLYSGLSRELALEGLPVEEDPAVSLEYHILAAQRKHRPSIAIVAESARSGNAGMPADWKRAADLFHSLLDEPHPPIDPTVEVYEYNNATIPANYEISAALASMYQEGAHGLEEDMTKAWELWTQAGDQATEAKKGRLAMTYYEKAAECE